MPNQPDQTDDAILEAIRTDGAMPISDISTVDSVGVTTNTIRTHLEGLKNQDLAEHIANGVWKITINGRHYLDGEYDVEDQKYILQSENPEQADLATQREIERAVRGMLKKWKSDGHTAQEINSGLCEMFMEKALQELQLENPREKGVMLSITESIEPEIEIHSDNFPHHMWLIYGGQCYDAEAPTGVDTWRELPLFQRAEDAGDITISDAPIPTEN